jgi:hypothetical protein
MRAHDFDYHFIYVLRHETGARKIGRSFQPKIRCRQISQWHGPCVLEYAAPCSRLAPLAEKHAHCLLWDRYLGNEWFDVDLPTARRAVMAAITAVRYGEELWEPMSSFGSKGKTPHRRSWWDNVWRPVGLDTDA